MNYCQTCLHWSPNQKDANTFSKSFCTNLKIYIHTVAELGCDFHVSSDAVEVNVPQHTKSELDKFVPDYMPQSPRNERPIDGPIEILIVTYAKDLPWLEYCLRGIAKHCKGFQGVTVAHPVHEIDAFCKLHKRFDLRLRLHEYDEVSGKGMIQHMVKMAEADLIVEPQTKYVMHLDADCIFHTATTPEDYFLNDKPVYVARTYDSLTEPDPNNPGKQVVSDCLQWKGPTETQLGMPVEWYTMCRHPTVLPIVFYKPYREHIAKVQKQSFETYMLSGRNQFPQDRMDWTAMGAWAKHFMPDKFHWHDCFTNPAPKDRVKNFWSHGGITPEIRKTLEGFVN